MSFSGGCGARDDCTGGVLLRVLLRGTARWRPPNELPYFSTKHPPPKSVKDSGVYVFAILGNRVYIIRRQRSRELGEVVPGETETETIREVNGK